MVKVLTLKIVALLILMIAVFSFPFYIFFNGANGDTDSSLELTSDYIFSQIDYINTTYIDTSLNQTHNEVVTSFYDLSICFEWDHSGEFYLQQFVDSTSPLTLEFTQFDVVWKAEFTPTQVNNFQTTNFFCEEKGLYVIMIMVFFTV